MIPEVSALSPPDHDAPPRLPLRVAVPLAAGNLAVLTATVIAQPAFGFLLGSISIGFFTARRLARRRRRPPTWRPAAVLGALGAALLVSDSVIATLHPPWWPSLTRSLGVVVAWVAVAASSLGAAAGYGFAWINSPQRDAACARLAARLHMTRGSSGAS